MRILVTAAPGSSGRTWSTGSAARRHEVVVVDNFDPFYPRAVRRRTWPPRRFSAVPAGRARHPRRGGRRRPCSRRRGPTRSSTSRPRPGSGRASRPVAVRRRQRDGDRPLAGSGLPDRAPAPVRLRVEFERLRRSARRPVPRDRPGRRPGQPLRRDQEGLRAAGLHVPPPPRPARRPGCGSSRPTARETAPTWPSPSSPA